MEKLLEGKCEACKADAPLVTPEERKTLMPQIPGWDVIEVDGIEQLTCAFAFKDYLSGLDFLKKVAHLAEEEDHHPEIVLEWGKVTVNWWSHKINGLHKNDFIAAAKTDALFSE